MTTSTRTLVGPRRPPRSANPTDVLNAALGALDSLRSQRTTGVSTLLELKQKYASHSRSYYALAALSRRRILEVDTRDRCLAALFPLRSLLERRILNDILAAPDRDSFIASAATNSFFGVSAKQGVSIRYALASCVPTKNCGGRCYAHDGRDRDLHRVFRGVLNFFLGSLYENGSPEQRSAVIASLDKPIGYGIEAALSDREQAMRDGYTREPRIRFSHVGEMAATPDFTNSLAREIVYRNPDIACVIYTRHPSSNRLDPSVLRVNFTVEGEHDPRWSVAPSFARIVSSAWNGELTELAAVNFLEHHVERSAPAVGSGMACPVTLHHNTLRSCDDARCAACFLPTTDPP